MTKVVVSQRVLRLRALGERGLHNAPVPRGERDVLDVLLNADTPDWIYCRHVGGRTTDVAARTPSTCKPCEPGAATAV
jgi:hypothetical protein